MIHDKNASLLESGGIRKQELLNPGRVPSALLRIRRRRRLADLLNVLGSELDGQSTQVLLQVLYTAFSRCMVYKIRSATLTEILVVPGMGMMSSPCARSHARAIWPAVALYFLPMVARPSASFTMFGKFSLEYRGTERRQSSVAKSSGLRYNGIREIRMTRFSHRVEKYLRIAR